MKKNIAVVLAFLFSFQVSTYSFAQSSGLQGEKKEIEDCYNKLFNNAQVSISKYVGKPVEISPQNRLQFLKGATLLLAKDAKSIDDQINSQKVLFSILALGLGAGDVKVLTNANRYNQNFKNADLLVRDVKSVNGETIAKDFKISPEELGKYNLSAEKSMQFGELESTMKDFKSSFRGALTMAVILTAIVGWCLDFALTTDKFSSDYSLSTLQDLFAATSEEEFGGVILSDGNPTIKEIRHRLLNNCQKMLKQDPASTLAQLSNITDQDVKVIDNWIKKSGN